MHTIIGRNAQQILPYAIQLIEKQARRRESRNGAVWVMDGPVTTVYERPMERVIFWPQRDANPFLHFFEALWMLAGRNDVEFPARFAGRFRSFSDDGETLHGAYGYRWRKAWGFDQLERLIPLLRNHPNTRRAVLTMWDPASDLWPDEAGRDVPCNQQAFFWRDTAGLNMTVTCRSNDIIWGCYGTNVVHFSMLQEYVAAQLGCTVGKYWQISNNFHAYQDTLNPVLPIRNGEPVCPYERLWVRPYDMVHEPNSWMDELEEFFQGVSHGFHNPFFEHVAFPLLEAHNIHTRKVEPKYLKERFLAAQDAVSRCYALDWKLACHEWLVRREAAALAKYGVV